MSPWKDCFKDAGGSLRPAFWDYWVSETWDKYHSGAWLLHLPRTKVLGNRRINKPSSLLIWDKKRLPKHWSGWGDDVSPTVFIYLVHFSPTLLPRISGWHPSFFSPSFYHHKIYEIRLTGREGERSEGQQLAKGHPVNFMPEGRFEPGSTRSNTVYHILS